MLAGLLISLPALHESDKADKSHDSCHDHTHRFNEGGISQGDRLGAQYLDVLHGSLLGRLEGLVLRGAVEGVGNMYRTQSASATRGAPTISPTIPSSELILDGNCERLDLSSCLALWQLAHSNRRIELRGYAFVGSEKAADRLLWWAEFEWSCSPDSQYQAEDYELHPNRLKGFRGANVTDDARRACEVQSIPYDGASNQQK
jgi:hypothetical protein